MLSSSFPLFVFSDIIRFSLFLIIRTPLLSCSSISYSCCLPACLLFFLHYFNPIFFIIFIILTVTPTTTRQTAPHPPGQTRRVLMDVGVQAPSPAWEGRSSPRARRWPSPATRDCPC